MSARNKTTLGANELRLGEISGIHGVQGWVKVFSDTQPRENIFKYSPWRLHLGQSVSELEVLHWRKQGKTLVAQLKDTIDREQARALIGAVVAIEKINLPELDSGEFYWSQLIGLRVLTTVSEDLGVVDQLVETGANDVLVVRGDAESIDQQERLIPWVPEQFVLDVDLEAGEIRVDWDPDF